MTDPQSICRLNLLNGGKPSLRLVAQRLLIVLELSPLVLGQKGQVEANPYQVGLRRVVAFLRVAVNDHLIAVLNRRGDVLELLDVHRVG